MAKSFLFNFYIFNFLISVICSVYCHEMLKSNLLCTQTQVTSLIVLTLQFHQILGCWTVVLPGNCVLLKQLSVDRCKMFAFLWCIQCYLFHALQAIHWLYRSIKLFSYLWKRIGIPSDHLFSFFLGSSVGYLSALNSTLCSYLTVEAFTSNYNYLRNFSASFISFISWKKDVCKLLLIRWLVHLC